MTVETIDLYEYFSLPRGEAKGGFLTAYARFSSCEIKKKLRPAMLVLPGGGYDFCSDREKEPIALAYVAQGYSAFTLEYSCRIAYPVALIEACMAVAYIRENAEKYGVDVEHIAAVGFSAGGHLAGSLATLYGEECVKKALGERADLVRINAVVLSYPVITMGIQTHGGTREVVTDKGAIPYEELSLEKRVTKDSVPAFIWHTVTDDCVPVENAFLMASAYRKAGVPFTLHIFEWGRHGLSLCNEEATDYNEEEKRLNQTVGAWFALSLSWLKDRNFAVKAVD